MEGLRWEMFSGRQGTSEETIEGFDEFSGTDVLMLENNFESEIVAKRFQEAGRLTFNSSGAEAQHEGAWFMVYSILLYN